MSGRPAAVTAPRAPFVLLVLALLGGGLVLLLLLNAASAADSFRQRSLQSQLSALNLQEQELQRQVANLQAPQALARAAQQLGLVPSGDPGFVVLRPDGSYRVLGTPAPATSLTTTSPLTTNPLMTSPGTAVPGQRSQSGGHR